MPQYFVSLVHTSDQCPSANAKVRERVKKGTSEMPKLAQKLGVKFLIGPLLVTTEHTSFAVVEAERFEAVQDFVMQSGLMQWNTVSIASVKPLEQAMKEIETMPPPIY